LPLHREIIKTKAKEFAEKLSNPEIESQMETIHIFQGSGEFHASDGWYEKFRRRHGLSRFVMAGESANADIDKAEDFIVNFLSRLIEE
jgi:hypothetical protein